MLAFISFTLLCFWHALGCGDCHGYAQCCYDDSRSGLIQSSLPWLLLWALLFSEHNPFGAELLVHYGLGMAPALPSPFETTTSKHWSSSDVGPACFQLLPHGLYHAFHASWCLWLAFQEFRDTISGSVRHLFLAPILCGSLRPIPRD